ncbi:MAG TPA: transglutaminase-like domain-containing protein [Ktedonobacterales bacterium]|nr:transglutaminase-like domain-containing protein [Ktedonobacterales bacterium]
MDTTPFAPLLRFATFAARPDAQLDLAQGALMMADIAYADLNAAHYQRRLGALATVVREALGTNARRLRRSSRALRERTVATRVLETLRETLADHEGLSGNTEDYYDPRNTYLHETLDRGVGLPITLSVIYLEVARRLGIPLRGVGLPSHFMVKWPLPREEGGDLYLDAFHGGKILDASECRAFITELMGATGALPYFDPRWSAPLGARAILTRMLNNLKVIYLHRGESRLALEVVDRLVLLRPDMPEELRDRGLLRLALGEPLLAAADIATYAERAPAAPEVGRLRRRMAELREVRASLN